MASTVNKEIQKYLRELERDGWRICRLRRGGHIKLIPPWPDAELVFVSATSSDWRSIRNIKAITQRIIQEQTKREKEGP